MATSEIGAAYADYTFGDESRAGIPFTYLMRDLLQFDSSIEENRNRMTEATRTCNLILGMFYLFFIIFGGFLGIRISQSIM